MAPTRSALVHRVLDHRVVQIAVAAMAISAALAFGVVGIGRKDGVGGFNGDMQFLWVAGKCWMHGANPYVLDDFMRMSQALPGVDRARLTVGFAYPPQIAPLSLALASLPLGLAGVLMALLNVGSVLALIWLCLKLAHRGPSDETRTLRNFVPWIVIGSPFTQHVLYMGQTSLLAGALLLGGWYLTTRPNRFAAAAILLACSTIKPQIALLPIVWLVVERRWKLVATVAGMIALLCAWPLATTGFNGAFLAWYTALGRYASGPVQVAGIGHVFGIASLLASAGIRVPAIGAFAVVALVLLWRRRDVIERRHIPGLLLAVAFLFLYAHDYDLAALSPFFASLWLMTRYSTRGSLVVSASLAALFVPQRLVDRLASPVLLHWREPVLLGLLLWFALSGSGASPERDVRLAVHESTH